MLLNEYLGRAGLPASNIARVSLGKFEDFSWSNTPVYKPVLELDINADIDLAGLSFMLV